MSTGKILIADGSKHDLELLTRTLVTAGYEVLQATDGSETVSTVRCHQPDLVLLSTTFPPDVSHGGGAFTDAFLIIEWLKRGGTVPRIILITDQDAAALQARAKAAGAVGLFQKPVNNETLLGVIERFLGPRVSQPG